MNAYLQAYALQALFDEEFRLRRYDGEYRWMRSVAMPRQTAERAFQGYVGATFDITARKKAEEELRDQQRFLARIESSALNGVYIYDVAAGHNIYINQEYTRITGYRLEDLMAMIPEDFARLFHPEDLPRVVEHVKQLEQFTDGQVLELEYRFKTADGRWIWCVSRDTPFERHPDGKIKQFIGCFLDITKRKQLELEREQVLQREQQARQLAEEANRAKDDWLAMVTHELRAPLNAMLGHARFLHMRRQELAPEFADFADLVRRNGERQNEIINDLLDTARITTGKLQLELGMVRLAHVVREALDTVRPAAAARQVSLYEDFASDCGTLRGDATRLQQVVWNLLTNAVKFTPSGGSVVIGLRCEEESLVLTVRDTGQGIAPDFLPHVFDRFSQQDTSRTRRHGGLGLGLALVKEIVELHGGTISAASDGLGCGALFKVSLPVNAHGDHGRNNNSVKTTKDPLGQSAPITPDAPGRE